MYTCTTQKTFGRMIFIVCLSLVPLLTTKCNSQFQKKGKQQKLDSQKRMKNTPKIWIILDIFMDINNLDKMLHVNIIKLSPMTGHMPYPTTWHQWQVQQTETTHYITDAVSKNMPRIMKRYSGSHIRLHTTK